jgi:hypothetical protein
MKYLYSGLIFIALAGSQLSCNSTDEQTNPQPQIPSQPGTASFRIDNVNWYAAATISNQGVLTAYRGNEILQIQFPSSSPGTYNITASSNPSIRLTQYSGRDYDTYACSPQGGRIVITANSGNTMSGTFTAKICNLGGGSESKEILNGVFNQVQIQ